MIRQPLTIEHIDVSRLRPYPKNARTHSKKQARQIADSIRRFGFINPVLIGDDNETIAGHGRVEATKLLGMADVPAVRLSHLDAAERRAYVMADNKLALNAGWDRDLLAIELQALVDLDCGVEITGFSLAEVDLVLDEARESSPDLEGDAENDVPRFNDACSVTIRPGDLWGLGRHRLLCGDARDRQAFDCLLEGGRADLVFTDPLYNVPIDGHGCGLGRIRHRVRYGDRRDVAASIHELPGADPWSCGRSLPRRGDRLCLHGLAAPGRTARRRRGGVLGDEEPLRLEQSNGGMGSFYRGKHELVAVFKVGSAAHTNTFGLGDTGRYRTNVWDYAGINTLRPGRAEELAMHPTVKPVALVADAIRDCSRRREAVLDPFGGSGTTLIAAEKAGRQARLIEFDPAYCDQILRRFERVTGRQPRLGVSGQTFETVVEERAAIAAASLTMTPEEVA